MMIITRLVEMDPCNQMHQEGIHLCSMVVEVILCSVILGEIRGREAIHQVIRVKRNQTGHMMTGKQRHGQLL